MLVVYVFLRRPTPTIAAGITVPLSLAGTCAAMWLAGFSINNLTLMALAVSVGFVVDDAIVMIENMFRNLEKGWSPMRAALEGARQIGFTVVSISVSLIAAFIPLLFMEGVVGRLLREFSVTLVFAIAVSLVVSLTVTPMICAHFVRRRRASDATRLDRIVEAVLGWTVARLHGDADHRRAPHVVMLTVAARHRGADGQSLRQEPEGLFSARRHRADVRLHARPRRHLLRGDGQAADSRRSTSCWPIRRSPTSAPSVGASGFNASVNRGRMFISLKPLAERDGLPTTRVIDRMRRCARPASRASASSWPPRRTSASARGRAIPTTSSRCGAPRSATSTAGRRRWSNAMATIPGLTDVSTDREQGGLQASITINRQAAARLGVRIQDINSALNNAFAQRQVSVIYTQRNQYRVILEVDPRYQQGPRRTCNASSCRAGTARRCPLTSVVTMRRARWRRWSSTIRGRSRPSPSATASPPT